MNDFLLPYKFKWVGVLLVIAGIMLLISFTWFKFTLTLPVVAVFSSYLETRMFTVFRTNVTDELIMLLFVTGFGMIALSREKTEHDGFEKIRSKALSRAVLANTACLLFSILFIYGNGFAGVLLVNLFSVFIFYRIFFYFLKSKEANENPGKIFNKDTKSL
jgi:hypothetical protein